MDYRVTTLQHGQGEYGDLLAHISADADLVARMWADAESRPGELDVPGTRWSVAVVRDGGRWVPAAWAAAVEADDGGRQVLRCHGNYEHPRWRGRGLYAAAYAHRHATVVRPSYLPAVTYLFSQPIGLHEADGWYRTGLSGVSTEAGEFHEWWQLRRELPVQ